MLDTLKPGQAIRCTITKAIAVDRHASTVARLMRFDADIKRRMKKGQEFRMKNLHVRSRGGRPWESRVKAPRHAVPAKGASWTMKFFPHVMPDFKSVTQYLKIESV